MAARPSVLAWRSLEGSGPQGHRVGDDLSDLAHTKHEICSPLFLRQIGLHEDLEDQIQLADSWAFQSWVSAVPENGPPAEPSSLSARAVCPPCELLLRAALVAYTPEGVRSLPQGIQGVLRGSWWRVPRTACAPPAEGPAFLQAACLCPLHVVPLAFSGPLLPFERLLILQNVVSTGLIF